VEEVPAEKDAEGDVPMPDAESARQLGSQGTAGAAEEPLPRVPPPPPGPVPTAPNATSTLIESTPVFAPDQPQRFLLPPQAPEHKGRKCLVLDLDETLVHSSFKVSELSAVFSMYPADCLPDPASGRLHNTGGDRG
jgi:carboxy-terminal domain RNA polymerase II polypeptide A small phosphatase